MDLLVVDWDYFVPVERDGDALALCRGWGHFETPYHLEEVWHSRAGDFLLSGQSLPAASGLEETFWSRFRFAPYAVLYYADSNALAWHERVRREVTAVWLFDAHHDYGYRDEAGGHGEARCDDRMPRYHRSGAILHVRYPQWRGHCVPTGEPSPRVPTDRQMDDQARLPVLLDRVFVCRSGAWTPSWLDGRFFAVLRCAALRRRVNLEGVQLRCFRLDDLQRPVAAEHAGLAILRRIQASRAFDT